MKKTILFPALAAGLILNALAQLPGGAGSQTNPVLGWAVGAPQNGSASLIATTDGAFWFRQGSSNQFAGVTLQGVKAVSESTCWVVGYSNSMVGAKNSRPLKPRSAPASSRGVIFRTDDGGATWVSQGSTLPPLYGLSVVDSNTAWAVGDRGSVYSTTNAGTHWNRVDGFQIACPQLQGVLALTNGSVWVSGVYARSMGSHLPIYYSADSGRTWTPQKNLSSKRPESILALSGDPTGRNLFAVGGKPYLIYTSTNGGQRWSLNTNTPTKGMYDANDVVTLDGTNAWIAADNGNLWSTLNGGAVWTKTSSPKWLSPALILGISAMDGENLWAVGTDRGKGVVLQSFDRGQTWQQRSQDTPMGSLWKISMLPIPAPATSSTNGGTDASGSDWMSLINDSNSLGSLSIPGTHDSMARFENWPDTAKCQSLSLEAQLTNGVRCLDIRCRHIKNGFAIHHGMVYQNANFTDVLTTCQEFLKSHTNETILMSVKHEYDDEAGITRSFAQTFLSYTLQFPNLFSLETTTTPSLGEVRGKIVLIRRFDETETVFTRWLTVNPGVQVPNPSSKKTVNAHVGGIDASAWPDNPEQVVAVGQSIELQDYYNLGDWAFPSAPWNYKWSRVLQALDRSSWDTAGQYLHLNFTSGVAFNKLGIPFILTVCNDINPRLDEYVDQNPNKNFGCILMDFAWPEIIRKIYKSNFSN